MAWVVGECGHGAGEVSAGAVSPSPILLTGRRQGRGRDGYPARIFRAARAAEPWTIHIRLLTPCPCGPACEAWVRLRLPTSEEAAGVMFIMTTVLITQGEMSNQRNGAWVFFERAVPLA